MYGGLGGGSVASATTGVATTVAGIAVLPNTGSSPILTVLSLATIAAGSLIIVSFVFSRIASRFIR